MFDHKRLSKIAGDKPGGAMANNLTLRLTAAGQVFISKNRKVSHPWRWGRAVVGAWSWPPLGCCSPAVSWPGPISSTSPRATRSPRPRRPRSNSWT